MARGIRLQTGGPQGTRSSWGQGGEGVEPSVELFPFIGHSTSAQACGDLGDDPTKPGDWPGDRQCILRLPEDIARRVTECLAPPEAESEPGAGAEAQAAPPELQLELEPLGPAAAGAPPGRRWKVRAFGEALNGTLVDLPGKMESHVLLSGPETEAVGGTGTAAYKSTDIYQMLIVHRGEEPSGATRQLDRRTYQWGSGITPPARGLRPYRFRTRPPADSEFAVAQIGEVVSAIRARMDNQEYVYEELLEVDEAEAQEIRIKQVDQVWRPPNLDKLCPDRGGAGTPGAPCAARAPSAASGSTGAPRHGLQPTGAGAAAAAAPAASAGPSGRATAAPAAAGAPTRGTGSAASVASIGSAGSTGKVPQATKAAGAGSAASVGSGGSRGRKHGTTAVEGPSCVGAANQRRKLRLF